MNKSKKKRNHTKLIIGLYNAIAILVLALITQGLLFAMKSDNSQNSEAFEKGSVVSLGSIEYDFSNGKAIKRTESQLSALKTFLTNEGERSLNSNCSVVYHNVVIASPDRKQVLLSYGCNHPGSRMFAIYTNDEWKLLSPTNHFDMLGIPSCEHVESNNIDRSIAPVCGKQPIQDSTELTYVVR